MRTKEQQISRLLGNIKYTIYLLHLRGMGIPKAIQDLELKCSKMERYNGKITE